MATTRAEALAALKTLIGNTPGIAETLWARELPTTFPAAIVFRDGIKSRSGRGGSQTVMELPAKFWLLIEPQPTTVDGEAAAVAWDETLDARFRGNLMALGADTVLWLETIEIATPRYLEHRYTGVIGRGTITINALVVNAAITAP